MHGHLTGKGQVYFGTYKDNDGDWLDVRHLMKNTDIET